jgi:hypothetical protein
MQSNWGSEFERTNMRSLDSKLNSDCTRLKAQLREFESSDNEQDLLESRLNRPIGSLRLKSSQPQSECPRTLQ